jgi:hypothetical protein
MADRMLAVDAPTFRVGLFEAVSANALAMLALVAIFGCGGNVG